MCENEFTVKFSTVQGYLNTKVTKSKCGGCFHPPRTEETLGLVACGTEVTKSAWI